MPVREQKPGAVPQRVVVADTRFLDIVPRGGDPRAPAERFQHAARDFESDPRTGCLQAAQARSGRCATGKQGKDSRELTDRTHVRSLMDQQPKFALQGSR